MNIDILSITACVGVIVLFFVAIQIFLLVSEIKQNKKWNAQNAAFTYCIQYSDLSSNIDMNRIDEVLKALESGTIKDINKIEMQQGLEDISIIMQYFERLSVGLICGYFDEEIVRRTMNRTVQKTYLKYLPYIEYRREKTKSSVLSHFERVAKAWEAVPMKYPYRNVPSSLSRENNAKKK